MGRKSVFRGDFAACLTYRGVFVHDEDMSGPGFPVQRFPEHSFPNLRVGINLHHCETVSILCTFSFPQSQPPIRLSVISYMPEIIGNSTSNTSSLPCNRNGAHTSTRRFRQYRRTILSHPTCCVLAGSPHHPILCRKSCGQRDASSVVLRITWTRYPDVITRTCAVLFRMPARHRKVVPPSPCCTVSGASRPGHGFGGIARKVEQRMRVRLFASTG